MRSYLTIWFGQTISLIGSGLTGFGLGVWAFEETGSVTLYSIIFLCNMLPSLILSPIAGVQVDRWNRRYILIAANLLPALLTLTVFLLNRNDSLKIWHIYVITLVLSANSTFRLQALVAVVAQLVSKENFTRASGLNQLSGAAAGLISPVAAGFLLGVIGLNGILIIDCITFLVAISTLLMVRIPKPKESEEGKAGRGAMSHEIKAGWRFIKQRPGLMKLIILLLFTNVPLGAVTMLITPLILSFADAKVLGMLGSATGAGLGVGGLLMATWGGPKRRMMGILPSLVIFGLCMILCGFRPSALLIGIAGFVFFLSAGVLAACTQAIWISKTPQDMQGRVFGVRRMLALSMQPFAYLLSGSLADKFFEPWMAEGGALAGVFGPIIGVGEGRGIGLMIILMGMVPLSLGVYSLFSSKFRNIEEDLADSSEYETEAKTESDTSAEETIS